MAKKKTAEAKAVIVAGKPSAILDTRVIYYGDNYNVLFQEQNGSRSTKAIIIKDKK